ncbi:MAG TPA: 23S rRNA (uracil(1939)-C(5))-methyltransferase RlmD [Oligoflexus sp.]|uniref:23S rRNA (uracil(1939)-C(5))-methyltransferase RlmD n=1 Tax=Oligoflexus sp. TaxID=1971216 RepID=UPI002D4AEC50|nr:23S rRNA (uracil(1939)-C(5))-methyltransferase RlmD [Oligoflexus sp.]HYX34637.1 23S rRNA (uracil(1939)-C(5))-methyltransferase RlmD [Oligoflexus sp.]
MTVAKTHRSTAKIFRSERWKNDHSKQFLTKRPAAPAQDDSCCGTHSPVDGNYENSLNLKYQAALQKFREHGLLEGASVINPVASPRSTGYRAHAKLAVRHAREAVVKPAAEERFAIGLFAANSHQVIHLKDCPMHRASINRLLPDLQAELEASNLQPYCEETHSGDLRYLAIRATHLTEELMLTFVTREEKDKVELKAMVLRLRQKGHLIVASFQNINPSRTNSIFGSLTKKLAGADGLRESLCGLTFEIGPTSFFQVNPWTASLIYRRVEQIAGHRQGDAVAWDLYCGTGQISLLLAQSGYRTLGIEENPQAIRDAEANCVRNAIPADKRPAYIAGRVEDLDGRFPTWADKPELIVANPSRRGLAPAARELVLNGLHQRPGSRLVYVSCEAETLIRDLVELTKAGHKLLQLECFDMFPYTEKLEWLAVIQ